MGKKSEDRLAEIGKTFLQYLKEKHLLIRTHISELKTIFAEFAKEKNIKNVKIYDLIYQLDYEKILQVDNHGFVIFMKEADSATSNEERKHSELIRAERTKIFNLLKSSQSQDGLIKGDGSIDITCEPMEFEKVLGHYECRVQGSGEISFRLIIRNKKKYVVTLQKCFLYWNSDVFSFSDEKHCTDLYEDHTGCKISADQEYTVNVTCKTTENLGTFKGDLYFKFKFDKGGKNGKGSFRIARFLTCTKSNQLVDDMKPQKPYTGKEKFTQYQYELISHGNRPTITGDNLERIWQLPQYLIPRNVRIGLKKKVFTKNFENSTSEEKAMVKLLKEDRNRKNYARKFSLLLQLEEIQEAYNIRLYDLKGVTLENADTSTCNKYWLNVPGLSEKRPSVLRGDELYLYPLKKETEKHYGSIKCIGFVHEVQQNRVLIHFGERFIYDDKAKFDVEFTTSRYSFRLQYRAVEKFPRKLFGTILFPKGVRGYKIDREELSLKNMKIHENKEQYKAVQSIVFGTSTIPYVIYGPPGTGKTVTIVEAIKQVLQKNTKARVLICAPSNSACNLLVQRLIDTVDKGDIFRMFAASYGPGLVPKEFQGATNYNQADRSFYFPTKQELEGYRVIAATLITAGRLASAQFPPDHFSYIFIDEAGYAREPELMTAVVGNLGEKGRLVLAGDPKQLGPVLYSDLAKKHGLAISYLENLMDQTLYKCHGETGYDERFVTKLMKNYRSHKAIIQVPNECFYDGDLEEYAKESERNIFCGWTNLPNRKFPVIFHSVKGEDTREATSPSFFNPLEVFMVREYVAKVLHYRGITSKDIGIISPYQKQVRKIRSFLTEKTDGHDGILTPTRVQHIKIGSVEEFQGQERKVIIISTVRTSNKHLLNDRKHQLGFLENPKRFNVAITRAKSLLIVIGDVDILWRDQHWQRFILHCLENRAFVGNKPKGFALANDRIDITARISSMSLETTK